MTSKAWPLEGAEVGVGDEIANSLVSRVMQVGTDAGKIDDAAADGLAGTPSSVAYTLATLEGHFHGWSSWFGAAVVPNGEIHVADRIGTTTAALQADAGNNTWGSWLQVLGSSDTPARAGMVRFDFQRIMVVAVENANAVHFVQMGCGDSGAAALAAGTYTERVFVPQSVQGQETEVVIMMVPCAAGTKCWLRVWVVGQNTSTVDFFIGLHEYAG